MEFRNLILVEGFHSVTPVPTEVVDEYLIARTALIVPPLVNQEDGTFDPVIWKTLLIALVDYFGSELEVYIDANQGWIPWTRDDLDIDWQRLPEDCREPPLRVRLWSDGVIVCRIETELWTRIGGPVPYHDTYTFSVFTNPSSAFAVRTAIEQVLRPAGSLNRLTAPFEIPPPPPSLWRRLWEHLR